MIDFILAAALATATPGPAELRAMAGRFAPAEIGADISQLPASERQALAKLVEAAKLVDTLYLRQAWAGNETLLLDLLQDRSELGQARLHLFLINKGPWSAQDGDAPFLPGIGPRPEQANFYPAGSSKTEVETWLKGLPEAELAAAQGFFTTLRRGTDGRFVTVPYSLEYQGELERMAALLQEAAALTQQRTLRRFLDERARALITNDYYESDLAWMELDASIEPTIGPYEVYQDGWFNFKAAFEAFIAVRDDAETAKLARFSQHLQDLEDHLPIDPKLRNPKLGALAPIRVVNVVYASGDGNHGVQTAAYNLPNDERVVAKLGSKRVMLKNMQQAKFEHALLPIAKLALSPADKKDLSFDAFFTHILMHELMHGLGPHNIEVGGRKTTVRAELKDAYSSFEEAKADISGLWALQRLVDTGVIDRELERTMYVTFLASAFRSLRFGLEDAHGRGMALQMNALLEAGAFKVAADGTFSVDRGKVRDAVTKVAADILALQASGDAAKAQAWLARAAVVPPAVQKLIERLKGVPIDIEPRFGTAAELTR